MNCLKLSFLLLSFTMIFSTTANLCQKEKSLMELYRYKRLARDLKVEAKELEEDVKNLAEEQGKFVKNSTFIKVLRAEIVRKIGRIKVMNSFAHEAAYPAAADFEISREIGKASAEKYFSHNLLSSEVFYLGNLEPSYLYDAKISKKDLDNLIRVAQGYQKKSDELEKSSIKFGESVFNDILKVSANGEVECKDLDVRLLPDGSIQYGGKTYVLNNAVVNDSRKNKTSNESKNEISRETGGTVKK